MPSLDSNLAVGGETYTARRDGMLALIERVRGCERRAVAKSAASRSRFEQRGQLLPRDRVALLLDPGTPFLELCTLAGLGMDTPDLDRSVPGGGVISGIGIVSGVRCMISASTASTTSMITTGTGIGPIMPVPITRNEAGRP